MAQRRKGPSGEELPLSRERMLWFAGAAQEARAAGDLELAVLYKSDEIHDANFLDLSQHTVVAATELIELYNELRAKGPVSREASASMIWGMKYAAARALGLPEIPFKAIDELLDLLEESLAAAGHKPYARWQAEAFRHFVAGDDDKVRALVERLLPHTTRANHWSQKMDCPACAFLDMARFLGPDATPEETERLLHPVLSGRERCTDSPTLAHALYATSLARAGRTSEALHEANTALRMRVLNTAEHPTLALIARVDAAVAGRDEPGLAQWLPVLVARIERVEDVYERLAAVLSAHHGARLLASLRGGASEFTESATKLYAEARTLARRMDARLTRPRHVAFVEAEVARALT